MPDIHASAVVDPAAQLADDVIVGPFCVVEEDVRIGAGSTLLPGTVLMNGTRVGARCKLGPYAAIGGLPMDRDFGGETSFVELDDDVEVRDFASVHRATGDGDATRVGARSLVMSYVHVAHNVQVSSDVVLTSNVQLGGHSHVESHATLGSGCMVHQFARIGAFAMVGAGSGVGRDILPYTLARGLPAEHYRLNGVGLTRHGITGDRYRNLEQAVRAARRGGWEIVDELAQTSPEVAHLKEFRSMSKRGLASFRRRT